MDQSTLNKAVELKSKIQSLTALKNLIVCAPDEGYKIRDFTELKVVGDFAGKDQKEIMFDFLTVLNCHIARHESELENL